MSFCASNSRIEYLRIRWRSRGSQGEGCASHGLHLPDDGAVGVGHGLHVPYSFLEAPLLLDVPTD